MSTRIEGMLSRWFPPRARLLPLVPGGPMDVCTVARLFGTFREWGHGPWSAIVCAIRTDWYAWRYSRALQSEDLRVREYPREGKRG